MEVAGPLGTPLGLAQLKSMEVKNESEVAQSCPTLSDPMDCSPQAPPSMGFSRQEYWSGLPFPSSYQALTLSIKKSLVC